MYDEYHLLVHFSGTRCTVTMEKFHVCPWHSGSQVTQPQNEIQKGEMKSDNCIKNARNPMETIRHLGYS